MRSTFALLVATAAVAFVASDAFAQVYVSRPPTVVYRPVYAQPAYVAPVVTSATPIVTNYAPAPVVTNYAPSSASPIVTNYAPADSAPIATNYAPADSAPIVTNYAPAPVVTNYAPAPIVTNYAPAPVVTNYAPAVIAAPAPVVTYRPALPVITYRQPVTYPQPTVVGYAGNVSTVYAVPVVAQPAVVRTKVYYPGQPIRNVLRAITP